METTVLRQRVLAAKQVLGVAAALRVAGARQCVAPLSFLPRGYVVASWVRSPFPCTAWRRTALVGSKCQRSRSPLRLVAMQLAPPPSGCGKMMVGVPLKINRLPVFPTVDHVGMRIPMGQVRGGDVGPSFIDVTVGASRRSRFRPRAVQEEHVVATLPENGRARIVKKTFRRQVMVRRAILVFDHFFSILEQARPLRGMVCCERLPVTFNCTVNFSDDFWIFGGNVASFSYVGGGFLFSTCSETPCAIPDYGTGEGNMGPVESVMPQRICLIINSAALSTFLTASKKR